MTKQPVLFFTIADEKNLKYAKSLENSFKKFHPYIPFYIVQGEELQNHLKVDPMFFYRATPILGEEFLDKYDLVVKMDSDSVVTGDLSYVWETKDYDVATVLNYNDLDAKMYGIASGWGIHPVEYVNCGFVAMRSLKFVHEWKVWCFTPQFDRLQYKEQDGLNVKIYHGNYNCRILDHGDGPAGMHAFWGLFGKSFWNKAVLRGEKIIIPKPKNGLPPADTELKVLHVAGGQDAKKDNWAIYFNEEVMKRINYLIGDKK